ncbi:hypothetical protein G9A89_001879 [Geosiphon pyriformis]|nr:hypothetical protein G9A89_001879 [Geosiphon pyriformis]
MSISILKRFSSDISLILKFKKDFDVIIQVGESPDEVRTFHAHSFILRARSAYFNVALSTCWADKKGDVYFFKKPNISARVFELLLGLTALSIRYIYTGTIKFTKLKAKDLLGLLIAADELILEELIDKIQNYLINNKPTLIDEYLIEILNKVISRPTCQKLLDHCHDEIICRNPNTLFKSNCFSKLEECTLQTILEFDDLPMKEIEIWDQLLNWAKLQNSSTDKKPVEEFTTMDFISVQKTLENLIPFIRFFQISFDDFNEKILPFNKCLSQKLFYEILSFHIEGKPPSSFKIQPSRIPAIKINSKLLKPKHAALLATWMKIDSPTRETNQFEVPYSFRLLYRASEDEVSPKAFHERCDKSGPTIVVLKIKNSEQLIGGFNPIVNGWRRRWFSSIRGMETGFLFSLHQTKILENTRISKVRENFVHQGIHDHFNDGICFGCGPDLWINLRDERRVAQTIQSTYEFPVRERRGFFYWDDLEVFEIMKKR